MKRIALLFGVLALVVIAGALADDGEGKQLYESKCAMCHGKDGVAKSMAKGSANLNDPEYQKGTSVEEIVKVTSEGKGTMKGYEGKLTEEQMKLVAEYILTLK